MRPRFANRGSGSRIPERGVSRRASMRPRFANRGSPGKPPSTWPPNRASMRPRFANRGSVAGVDPLDLHVTGFNEAPIRESGKSGSSAAKSRTAAGFNEAPIRESGK